VPWTIYIVPECEGWLSGLSSSDRVNILQDAKLLAEFGPQLGRPHVDHIKGSRHANMKELRSRFDGHQYRTLFAFDPRQQAVLLIGGDKVGQDQGRFYKALVKLGDSIYDRHLARLTKEKSKHHHGDKP
jgi:hypothetical protein